jgi:predicted cupin superfamily sugar epimerase
MKEGPDVSKMSKEAQTVIDTLGLVPHPAEGGWFVETWRAEDSIPGGALDGRYGGAARRHGTAIYYLLTPDTVSALHRLESDEVFHFYMGDPVEQLHLFPDGSGRTVTLGTDLAAGQRPQAVVPRGVWQGARLVPGGAWALLGCTVAPGFDFADYAHGQRAALIEGWPDHAPAIVALTSL